MSEKILLISEKNEDLDLLASILGSDRYSITRSGFDNGIEKTILENVFPLILADYELVREKADLLYDLQKTGSNACLIFYGDGIGAEDFTRILQKGVYTIIPRPFLQERLGEAVVGGLENRRAFIEILGMMDELKVVNQRLEEEKDTLRKRNQELSFINQLSREISYDLTWNSILSRMKDAGLEDILEYSLFGILFRIGSDWNLALHLPETVGPVDEELLKSEIISRLDTDIGDNISEREVGLQLIVPEPGGVGSVSYRLEEIESLPLNLAGKYLGSVFYVPRGDIQSESDREKLMNTLANILSLSLKNAQEYHKLREATVTDNLTGIYNRKGLHDFLSKEFERSKRYGKPLSFVMIDMDDFKSVNDSMGHQAGDFVLRGLAEILKGSVRQPDIVARYGGDEFAILLPESSLSDAMTIMERVSLKVEQHAFEWGSGRIKTRMSYGISNTNELLEGQEEEALVRLADSRLYVLKHS